MLAIDTDRSVARTLELARQAGREFLLEPEALAVAASVGIRVPRQRLLAGSAELGDVDLDQFPGDGVVLKIVSADVQHKTDVGGIAVVPRRQEELARALERMSARHAGAAFSINEFVAHDASLGGQLLLGMRWSEAFGPLITLGAGGVETELLGTRVDGLRPVVLSPERTRPDELKRLLARHPIVDLLTGSHRGRRPRMELDRLVELLQRWASLALAHMPAGIAEFEINPLVVVDGEPVALDALLRLGVPTANVAPDRPIDKLERLLRPRSVAVVGVSRKLNPGRIIVDNLLRDGFDRQRIVIVKRGVDEIAGCRCVPDVASLPGRVDLLVVCVDAEQVPAVLDDVVRGAAAESLIVIPGGLGERRGTEELARRIRRTLVEARRTEWRGPLVNGGNCLGVRSRPGRYDTMFIPQHKLPQATAKPGPLALISQSGALMVSRASKLERLNPRYLISVGNQIDLTVGDYLEFLERDDDVRVFACYVEGFRPGDGSRWLRAARRIVDSGRTVVLYLAGRTAEGARASASHTASVAGDYRVARQLARAAGVVVAESLEEFDDLIRLFCATVDRPVRGRRLGALSNAGFECVALADHLGRLRLEPFGSETRRRLGRVLDESRLDRIVEAANPVDVNPLMGDAAFEEAARAVLEDDDVDVAVIGCVPLTGALTTLPQEGGVEFATDSIVRRLVRLYGEATKPWVAVVDAGRLYDPMAAALESCGLPVFRSADRALRVLNKVCDARLDRG